MAWGNRSGVIPPSTWLLSVSRDTVGGFSRPDRYPVGVPLPSLGRLSSKTSNLKAAVNAGRHRNNTLETTPAVEDHELTSYLAALAPESAPESTGTGKRFGEAQVFQLRMNLIASEQLKDIAAERELSPQALAQEWILERLSWEAQAVSAQDQRQTRFEEEHQRGAFEEGHTDELRLDQQRWEQPASGRLY